MIIWRQLEALYLAPGRFGVATEHCYGDNTLLNPRALNYAHVASLDACFKELMTQHMCRPTLAVLVSPIGASLLTFLCVGANVKN